MKLIRTHDISCQKLWLKLKCRQNIYVIEAKIADPSGILEGSLRILADMADVSKQLGFYRSQFVGNDISRCEAKKNAPSGEKGAILQKLLL